MQKTIEALDQRILVLAPTGRDGPLTCETLCKNGALAQNCETFDIFRQEFDRGAAAGIIAEEALTPSGLKTLVSLIEKQPPWSDFPIIIITNANQTADISAGRYDLLKDLGNLTILERPFHAETFLTAVRSSLRTRQRQYDSRSYLHERQEYESAILQLNETLERKVSERTQELITSQHALSQAQRLEAIGRLAGGIAHDFNNLMTGILGIVQEVAADLGRSHAHADDLDQVIKAAQKASQLTRQLLAFGRRQVAVPAVLDINAVILDMTNIFARLLGENIRLNSVLHSDLYRVSLNQSQLEQVLLNLVLNARDAMPQGGEITIRSANIVIEQGGADTLSELPAGPYITISIADTGSGIPPEMLTHLFEPFYTTKDVGKGSGLGLATVYGILKQNGGDVSVVSEIGTGTTFTLYLPQTTGNKLPDVVPPPQSSDVKGSETILVVEDEEIVRRVVVKALKKAGYQVLEAPNAEDALIVCSQHPSIDLLLTDMVMPGMNGRQLTDALQAQKRHIPVLFMSGHTEDVILRQGIFKSSINFIEKTFSTDALRRKVRDVLDNQATKDPQNTL